MHLLIILDSVFPHRVPHGVPLIPGISLPTSEVADGRVSVVPDVTRDLWHVVQ